MSLKGNNCKQRENARFKVEKEVNCGELVSSAEDGSLAFECEQGYFVKIREVSNQFRIGDSEWNKEQRKK